MKSAKSAFHPRTKDWMLLPSLCGIGLFYLIPLVQSIFYAFSDGLYAARFVGGYNFRTLCRRCRRNSRWLNKGGGGFAQGFRIDVKILHTHKFL